MNNVETSTPRIIAIFENNYHIYSFIQLWILFKASKLSKGYSLNIKVATLYHDACVFMSYMIEAKFLRVGIFLHVGIHFNKYNLKILHYLRMLLNNIDLKWVFLNYSSVKILHILGLGIMTWPNINLLNRRMLPPNFQLFWSISFFLEDLKLKIVPIHSYVIHSTIVNLEVQLYLSDCKFNKIESTLPEDVFHTKHTFLFNTERSERRMKPASRSED